MKRNPTRPRLKVTADGRSVIGHAGARLLSDLADEVGLTGGLSEAMAPTKKHLRHGIQIVHARLADRDELIDVSCLLDDRLRRQLVGLAVLGDQH